MLRCNYCSTDVFSQFQASIIFYFLADIAVMVFLILCCIILCCHMFAMEGLKELESMRQVVTPRQEDYREICTLLILKHAFLKNTPGESTFVDKYSVVYTGSANDLTSP